MPVAGSSHLELSGPPATSTVSEDIMRKVVLDLALAVVLVSMAGCYYIPAQTGAGEYNDVLTQDDLDFLAVSGPNLGSVRERFGNAFSYFPENVVVYNYRWRTSTTYWSYAVPVPILTEVVWIGESGENVKYKDYILLIQLSDSDEVIRYGFYERPLEWNAVKGVEDWLSHPMPDYFKPVTLLKRNSN
jgi:hypothetical protein